MGTTKSKPTKEIAAAAGACINIADAAEAAEAIIDYSSMTTPTEDKRIEFTNQIRTEFLRLRKSQGRFEAITTDTIVELMMRRQKQKKKTSSTTTTTNSTCGGGGGGALLLQLDATIQEGENIVLGASTFITHFLKCIRHDLSADVSGQMRNKTKLEVKQFLTKRAQLIRIILKAMIAYLCTSISKNENDPGYTIYNNGHKMNPNPGSMVNHTGQHLGGAHFPDVNSLVSKSATPATEESHKNEAHKGGKCSQPCNCSGRDSCNCKGGACCK